MNRFLFFISVIIFLGSCTEDDPIEISDFHKKKENLVGTWQLFEHYVIYWADTVKYDVTHELGLIFNEDGTGERQLYINGPYVQFDWRFQCDPDKVWMDVDTRPYKDLFEIVKVDGNMQEWEEVVYRPFPPLYDPANLQPEYYYWKLEKLE